MTIFLMMLAATATAASDCGDRPSQTAMTMCQKAAAARADADMNRVWRLLQPAMRDLDRRQAGGRGAPAPDNAAALLVSQRAWLAFRDAECRIESYEWRGGSMQPFAANQCMTDVTLARTRQLRTMLEWTRR